MHIRRGKHPHEVGLLFATMVIGGFGTVAFDRSATSVVRALAQPYGQVMYAALATASAVAMSGIFWRGITGALIERAGLIAIAPLCLGLGASTLAGFGLRGLAFGAIFASFAAASACRVWQIRREVKEILAADKFLNGRPRR